MLSPITGNADLDSFLRFLQDKLSDSDSTEDTQSVNTSTGEVLDPATNQPVGYLYKNLHVKYADDALGTNISDVPTGKSYYGIRNSNDPVKPTNPAEYSWKAVSGGFGASKSLWYLLSGGRQISFVASVAKPADAYVLEDGSVIDLDNVLTPGVVVGSFLADGSVSGPKLADGSVSEPKIADGSVSEPKIADASLSTRLFQPDSIPASALKSDIVNNSKATVSQVLYSDVAVQSVSATSSRAETFSSGNYTRTFNGFIEVVHDSASPIFLTTTVYQQRGIQVGQAISNEHYVLVSGSARKLAVHLYDLFSGDSAASDTDIHVQIQARDTTGALVTNITNVALVGTITLKEENFP